MARLRANHVSPPTATGAKSLIMRSAMWRQRQERQESLRPRGCRRSETALRIVHMMLAWLIIVPFGRPGRAARVDERGELLGLRPRRRASSNRPGSRCSRAAPIARSSSKPTTNGSSSRSSFSKTIDPVELGQPVPDLEDLGQQLVVLDEAHARLGVARGRRRPVRVSSSGRAARSRCRWRASPKSARCHSTRLLEKMPTCSPGPIPSSASPAVTSRTARP